MNASLIILRLRLPCQVAAARGFVDLAHLAPAGYVRPLSGSDPLGQSGAGTGTALKCMLDSLALFFKRFLIRAVLVLLISVEYSDRIQSGIAEFYALFCSRCGMLAASANDFLLVFVSLDS
jgi:hypothetical protein